MFIFIDVQAFREKIDYNQTITCPRCGHFGRYEVYVSGNRFRLFFIPLMTYGKKYLVRATCCDSWYVLDTELGKAIERGDAVEIMENNLHLIMEGSPIERVCRKCGASFTEGAHFCPNCGSKLD